MGYSIAVHAKEELRDKMIKFMEKNFHEQHVVFGGKDSYARLTNNTRTKDERLSYDHNKMAIGFDYGGLDEIGHYYLYAICRWMALKVGQTMKKKYGIVPFWVYDGCEKSPVLLDTEWKGKIPKEDEQYLTDKVGFKDYKRMYGDLWNEEKAEAFKDLSGITVDELNNKTKAELERLDELWTKEG
jgi:hypothetical protein